MALHSRALLDSLEDNTVVLVGILCKNHKRYFKFLSHKFYNEYVLAILAFQTAPGRG